MWQFLVFSSDECSMNECTHVVEFKIEATGVAHRLATSIASPQCRSACVAVGALCSSAFADNLTEAKFIVTKMYNHQIIN